MRRFGLGTTKRQFKVKQEARMGDLVYGVVGVTNLVKQTEDTGGWGSGGG